MSEYNELWYRSADGLRLFARDYSGSRSGADPTIVCIPGLTRNSADFHQLCVHLQAGFRVIAVDLRGRGRSDRDENPANYHPGIYVEDVNRLIDELGLASVVFVGTSLGALVSMLIAAARPRLPAALVLNDFGPELRKQDLQRIKSYVGNVAPVADWEAAVNQCRAVNGRELPDLSDRQWLDFAKNLYRQEPGGNLVLDYDARIAEPFNQSEADPDPAALWAVYDALPDVPLLVLRGALSELLGAECVKEMQRRRDKLNWVEVPNRGHAPLLNEPPALEAIDGLLRSLKT
ncbi:alpha/beta fold hydrolase [Gilvimarinus sp. F26214L]|uniref:alpha/beta fold hydrolase n=1 Tax=Gilvimarinus sp. DZF01 TaxID=3461371 RepID=UPI004045906A